MRKYLVFFLIALIASCSGGKKNVKVVDTNLMDENMPVSEVLKFTFSKELATDTLLNTWQDIEYLKITPEINGRYMWTAPNRLIFAPENPMNPATAYEVKITNKVVNDFDYKLKGKLTYYFQTPYLEVKAVNGYWGTAMGQDDRAYLHFAMQFNYELNPEEVASNTDIEVNGKSVDFRLVTTEPTGNIQVYLPNLIPEDKEYKAKVVIKKGLKIDKEGISLEDDIDQEFTVSSPYKLDIQEVMAEHTGNEGRITIYTTQQVEKSKARQFISLDPAVNYKLEVFTQYMVLSSTGFSVDRKYEVKLRKGLPGSIGGELKYDYNQDVSFGQLEPTIKFVNQKETYVSSLGSKNIEVAIINVPKVEIKMTKVYENNILKFLNNYGSSYYGHGYHYDYYSYSRYHNVGNLGDVIYEKVIETKELPRQGSHRLLKLDFEDKLNDYKGLYVISVKSPDDYYLKASKIVSISDIGLIVKKGKNQVSIFANSIKTTEALANVKLNMIGRNNQLLGSSQTDADGVAVFAYNELPADNFELAMVTAQYNADYTYLPFSNTSISTSRFDIGGRHENPAGIEAYIYGDRDIYRPGETVNITGIVRGNEWDKVGQVPVIVKFITPGGKEYKKIKKILNGHGSFETNIDLVASAMTGSYTAEVYTSNNVLIGSQRIKVEEFVPDRIKVDVELDKKEYRAGDIINIDITAVNFFGPPAANRNYEVEMSTKNRYFYPEKNRDFNYSIVGVNTYFRRNMKSGKTDDRGKALQTFNIPTSYSDMGILQSDFYATVFDETGRPVNRKKSVTIYTQDHFYGIKYDNYYAKAGKPVNVQLIAVDKNGEAQDNISTRVVLIRHEYKTVLSKSGSYYKYRSEKIEKVLDSKTMQLSGPNNNYSFTPDLTGQYEIRVSSPTARTYVSRYIWAYGWGRNRYSSFEVDNEGRVDMEFDKDKYEVGDKAEVLLKAPFDGKILVAIESNKVVDHFYVNTEKRAAKFTLDVKEEFVPNVYISATLIRPHEVSELPFTVAHGWSPILVENPDNKLPIEIKAVEKSRSKTKQVVTVKSKPNSAITIAAVDEGILQVTGFQTPDPYKYFYRKRALEVKTYDIYPYLFPELGMARSVPGGGGMDMEKRVNPLSNDRVKLVALWSGILETDGRGEASFTLDIPQHSGSLRIMAVGYKDKAFGAESQNMVIADPIVISTPLPRFFSPGDTVLVPVMVSNTTKKSEKCKTTIEVEGPIDILGSAKETKTIDADGEQRFTFKLAVKRQLGQSKVTIKVEGGGETFENVTDITVRPASPLQKVNGSGIIQAGNTQQIKMDIARFMPKSVDNQLVVSKSPLIQFMDDLEYLVRYPYGCIEQTVSKAFPQLYYNDIAKLLYSDQEDNINIHHHVQVAIDKIKLMQLYNGGLTYWPGQGTETWWGSAYAAHFLVEAKKAGYDVDDDVLKDLLKYLRVKLKDKQLVYYYYNGNQRRKIVPKSIPYSLYILALADKPARSVMNYYKSDINDLSLDGKYLLAAAYGLTGSKKEFQEILPVAFEGEKSNTVFGGSFYSHLRDEAIALNAILEVDPENQQVGIMAKHVSESLKNKHYLNTQERTFSFLALGKIAREDAKTDASAIVKANGKQIGKVSDKAMTFNTAQLEGSNAEISVQGTGRMYYFWESEGISKDGSYREEDNYIKVRKKFYDRYGNPVEGNSFTQNDLVLVELSISKAYDKRIDNVVISDILPAGFEIENPRITVLPSGMEWPHQKSRYDYMDVRDDRINFFVDLYGTNTRYYYYLVRAVSMGTFQLGPVGADAMYNGEYHSYHGGGQIVVKEKR